MPLSDYFSYDERSHSCLARKTDWVSGKDGRTTRAKIGDPAGALTSSEPPYYCVYADGRLWQAHVVVWVLFNPEGVPLGLEVDHKDGNRLNNRIDNLRIVTPALNARNQKKKVTNLSGVSGVHFKEDIVKGRVYSRWIAQVFDLTGKRLSKSFSCQKYGEEAFVLACQTRDAMLSGLNAQGAGYSTRHGT